MMPGCDGCKYYSEGVWGWCCELGYDPQLFVEERKECPYWDDGAE